MPGIGKCRRRLALRNSRLPKACNPSLTLTSSRAAGPKASGTTVSMRRWNNGAARISSENCLKTSWNNSRGGTHEFPPPRHQHHLVYLEGRHAGRPVPTAPPRKAAVYLSCDFGRVVPLADRPQLGHGGDG